MQGDLVDRISLSIDPFVTMAVVRCRKTKTTQSKESRTKAKIRFLSSSIDDLQFSVEFIIARDAYYHPFLTLGRIFDLLPIYIRI